MADRCDQRLTCWPLHVIINMTPAFSYAIVPFTGGALLLQVGRDARPDSPCSKVPADDSALRDRSHRLIAVMEQFAEPAAMHICNRVSPSNQGLTGCLLDAQKTGPTSSTMLGKSRSGRARGTSPPTSSSLTGAWQNLDAARPS